MPPPAQLIPILFLTFQFSPYFALNFLFNSFNSTDPGVIFAGDATVESSVLLLTNKNNHQFSSGRIFYPTRIQMKSTQNPTVLSSFSTSFVFSILPQIPSIPGSGLAFALSNWTNPPNSAAVEYFGLFSNSTAPTQSLLLAVEFDTGQNREFNDPEGNHIGINLNSVESVKTAPAAYFNSSGSFLHPVNINDGQNVRAWIDFDGSQFEIQVRLAPVGVPRPLIPTLSYRNPAIANYVSAEMFVGFSASNTNWNEAQRILAWSFSDSGTAREINMTNLPDFKPLLSSDSLSAPATAAIAIGCVVFVILCAFGAHWFWKKKKKNSRVEDDGIEDWEVQFWPHRYSYDELTQATDNFSKDRLMGAGGFGKVYKGILSNNNEIAVKCINHESKQGLREFMAEISSLGRLQQKNLVQLRGWCRKSIDNELLLVYDFMPHASLDRYIFHAPAKLMGWKQRRRVLSDVAEGLSYLHHGWDQVVVHRDIKSSNILLDSEMRGRLGDFGLAKLYDHSESPHATRVVGTLGYLAPELAAVAVATTASDVYSFGVVVLEVACGRRPIGRGSIEEEEEMLVDVVRDLYLEGRVAAAADRWLEGEYEVAEMETVLKLGLACCHPDPARRPSMKEVVAVLCDDEAAARVEVLTELPRGAVDDNSE